MSDQHYVDQVLANLKVISMVKEGGRLRLMSGQLSTDCPSPYQPVRRWYYGDTRNIMIAHVRGIIHNAINIVKIESMVTEHIDPERIWITRKIVEALKNAQDGMKNLMNTYEHDAVIICALEVLIDKIINCVNNATTESSNE